MSMKKIASLLLAAVMVLVLTACSKPAADGGSAGASQGAGGPRAEGEAAPPAGAESGNGPDSAAPDAPDAEPDGAAGDTRILVAYFSATNVTEGVAQKLAEGLGADLYEILPQQPYTSADLDYGDPKSRSSAEMDDPGARPAVSGSVEDMEQYDVVLIGYPIWWGEAPRIVSTFIESYDLSGKTLAAFCTSASSGFGRSDSALRAAADTAVWLDGRRFSGSASAEDILAWADGLGIREG